MATKKFMSLERLEEYDALIKAKIDNDIENHTHSWNDLEDKPFGETVTEGVVFEEQTRSPMQTTIFGWLITMLKSDSTETYLSDLSGSIFTLIVENTDVYTNDPSRTTDNFIYFNTPYGDIVANKYGDLYFPTTYLVKGQQIDKGVEVCIKMTAKKEEIIYIDEKFIPESIARISDIPEPFSRSWNDLTDKPFEETFTKSTEHISGEFEMYTPYDGSAPIVGKTYCVVFDGKEYFTVCQDYYGSECYLGNYIEEDNGFPFSFWFHYSNSTWYFKWDDYEVTTKNIAIYETTLDVTLLDEKFIPDTIARTQYVDEQIATKADASHAHDDLYYTETEVDELIAGVDASITNITSGTTPVKKAEEATHATTADSATSSLDADKLGGQLPSYYAKASDIPTGALASKDVVSESDLDSALAEKVNAASEGNHSHLNKTVLDGITSEKVSSWDSSLDEAKAYADTKTNGMATTTVVDNKINSHNSSATAHTDIRDLISTLTTKVNNFLDVDDATTDQLSEVLTLINNNKGTLDSLTSGKVNVSDIVDNLTTANANKVLSANQGVILKGLIDALQEAVDGKAGSVHTHAISDVTNLQSALNAKASQTDLDALEEVVDGKSNTGHGHAISDVSGLQSALDAKAAQTDLNAFENVVSGKADKATTLAGYGITNAYTKTEVDSIANGKADKGHGHAISEITNLQNTLDAKASKTEFDTHVADTTKHITSTERTNWNAAKSHADSAHAPSNAQANVIESIKVNGTAQTVTSKSVNITVPTDAADIGAAPATHSHAISDITNLQTTLNNASSAIGANTSSINAHTDRISALETKVGDGYEEISSEEIRALFAD